MGPTWGPSGADRTQVGPMLAPMDLAIWVYPYGMCNQEGVTYTSKMAGSSSSPSMWIWVNIKMPGDWVIMVQVRVCRLFVVRLLPEPMMTDCQLCLLKLIWIKCYLKFDFSVNNVRLKMWFCKMTAFCSGHNVSRHAMSSVLIVSRRKHTCEIIVDVAAQLAAVKLINQMKRICQYLRPMRINKYILEHNAIWPVQTNYIGAFCLYGVHALIAGKNLPLIICMNLCTKFESSKSSQRSGLPRFSKIHMYQTLGSPCRIHPYIV